MLKQLKQLNLLMLILYLSSTVIWGQTGKDWKKDILPYFSKAYEYGKISQYLEYNLATIPDDDKPRAIIVLSYSYSQQQDHVNENKWITRYFKRYRHHEPDFAFLGPGVRVKLFEYVQRWKRRFPGVKSFRISEESKRIPYFSPPSTLSLEIEALAPSQMQIKNETSELLYSGYINNGINTVTVAFIPAFKQYKTTTLTIHLSTPSIRLEQILNLNAAFSYPDGMAFEPVSGTLSVKGKSFGQETSEKVVEDRRRYFDGKHFKRKALFNLATGIGLLLLDQLVIRPASQKETASQGSRAFLNGFGKTSFVLGVGFSLKGIIHIFKSYKTEKRKRTITVTNPETAARNNALRSLIEKTKKEVFVNFSVSRKQENSK